jgi:hypothetical protein
MDSKTMISNVKSKHVKCTDDFAAKPKEHADKFIKSDTLEQIKTVSDLPRMFSRDEDLITSTWGKFSEHHRDLVMMQRPW